MLLLLLSKDLVLAKMLFDDDGYLIETINLPHKMLQRPKTHMGFEHHKNVLMQEGYS